MCHRQRQRLRQVRRQALARSRAGPARQRLRERGRQAVATLRRQLPQHLASAALQRGGVGIGRTHHHRQDSGFLQVQPAGVFAKELLRRGGHAHQFTAQGHVVEVGLEDLRLAPLRFKFARAHHLRHLDADAAATRRPRQFIVQQAGQLHRQR